MKFADDEQNQAMGATAGAPLSIYPSLLSFDFSCLRAQIVALTAAGAAGFHFDVMDGQFVPNLTFGALVPRALRPHTPLPFAAHLMVYTPEALIDPLVKAGVSCLYLHPESTPHIHRALGRVRDAGAVPGIAINPGTPLVMLEPVLELVEAILVMTVNPGFGGQAFIPTSLGRVAELRALLERRGLHPAIECDGGVDSETIGPLRRAGMTGAVIGSALFAQGDPAENLRRFQQAAGC